MNIDKELLKCEMALFLDKNKDFDEFVRDCMKSYGKTAVEVLESPITVAYYKTLLPGGCNYREEVKA